MAHVDDQTHAVHLGHPLAPHAGEACVLGLIAARRKQGLVVVGQLHEPQTQTMQHLDQPNIIFDAGGVLRAKENCRAL